jgi:hypothetical protein
MKSRGAENGNSTTGRVEGLAGRGLPAQDGLWQAAGVKRRQPVSLRLRCCAARLSGYDAVTAAESPLEGTTPKQGGAAMTVWNLQLIPETAQPFKEGQPDKIARLVDAAVEVAETGRSIDSAGRETGYIGVVPAVRNLIKACQSCSESTPNRLTVRKRIGDLRLSEPGGLFGEIRDRVSELSECDKNVNDAKEDNLRTQRKLVAEKLELSIRDSLDLAHQVYNVAVKSGNA